MFFRTSNKVWGTVYADVSPFLHFQPIIQTSLMIPQLTVSNSQCRSGESRGPEPCCQVCRSDSICGTVGRGEGDGRWCERHRKRDDGGMGG